eukprot:11291548-Karenia_brevis.AAC.1
MMQGGAAGCSMNGGSLSSGALPYHPHGTRVQLHGLAAVELNGQCGIVITDTQGKQDGRYPVKLDSGKEVRVKEANMK